uniref:Uncharacterized protein n=1 Tax=Lactuca sativa TaxID=4236 RepID=A0A9R1VC94_LACSA|nr:hypothetical protein LSAT_V11C500249270 [Lactuca sativa]
MHHQTFLDQNRNDIFISWFHHQYKTESTVVLRCVLQMWKKDKHSAQTQSFLYRPDKISESVVIECKYALSNDSNFHTVTKYIIPINVQDHYDTLTPSD